MTGFDEGVPCWVDLLAANLPAAKRFYGELFGWTFGPSDTRFGRRYATAERDGKQVAALVSAKGRKPGGAWNVYFAAKDAEAMAKRIAKAGGTVRSGPIRLADLGTALTAVDPGGTVFGVWQAGTRAGFELAGQGQHGCFFWPEVYTRDKATVDPFYEKVFGYKGQQVAEGEEFDFKVWSVKKVPYPVAGRLQMNHWFPAEMQPHLLVYFWSEDCDKSAEQIRDLGGRIEREPTDSPFGRSALATDPHGARFGIMGPTS
jgi:predicted enzyme related to lactoylglutathione lyase